MESNLKVSFKHYLENVQQLRVSSVNCYANVLQSLSDYLRKNRILDKDIYEIRDVSLLKELRDFLYLDSTYLNWNFTGHSKHHNSLRHYINFIQASTYQQ